MKKEKKKNVEMEKELESAMLARIWKNSSWVQKNEVVGKTVDSLCIVDHIFDTLFECFEKAMLDKRVQDLYVDYCIDQVIDWAVTPISIERVSWDRQPENYAYDEECIEPTAGRLDFHVTEQKLCDVTKLN